MFLAMFASKMNPRSAVLSYVRIVHSHNHLSRHKWLVICIVLLLSGQGTATSVIVIEVQGGILYLATDSLVKNGDNSNTRLACKIYRSGDMYWAAAGTTEYGYTNFSVPAIIASIGNYGSLDSKMTRFIEAATTPMEKSIADSKPRNRKLYARLAAGKTSPLQIVFLSLEEGKPSYREVTFVPKMVRGRIKVTAQPFIRTEPTPQNPIMVGGLGIYETAFSYLVKHANSFPRDPIGIIEGAVTAQSDATPKLVSAPASIVRLDRTGFRWEQQGMCKQ
jgi:hypothetical protein